MACEESSHLNDCSGNSTFYNFSISMQQRRNTCVMGQWTSLDPARAPPAMPSGRAGYWRHPGFTLQGSFTYVDCVIPGSGCHVISGALSYGDCAAYCDDAIAASQASGALSRGCNAFSWNEDDRLCLLMVSSHLYSRIPPFPSPSPLICSSLPR